MSLEQIQHDVFGSDRSDIPMIPYIDRRLSHELFSCTRIEWFALERTTKTHCWWLLLWCPPKQPRKQEHLKQASSSVLLRVVISLFRLVIFSSKALMILDRFQGNMWVLLGEYPKYIYIYKYKYKWYKPTCCKHISSYGGSFMVTYPVSQPPNLDGPSTQSWREAVLPGKHVDCPLSLQVMSLVDIWLGIQESNQCSINKKMHKECTTKASSIVLLRLVISLLTAANFSSKAWCKWCKDLGQMGDPGGWVFPFFERKHKV